MVLLPACMRALGSFRISCEKHFYFVLLEIVKGRKKQHVFSQRFR